MTALEGTVKTPAGPVKKKTLAAVAAVAAVVAVIFWYRSRQAGQAAAASTTAAGAIDPATGLLAGSPEDAAALAQQASYVQPVLGGGAGGGSAVGGVPQGFATDGAWAQAAEDYLVGTTGADPQVVGLALGKYITGQVVTDSQENVINQAIAFEGYPPVSGHDGYPPSIRKAPPPVPAPPPPPAVFASNPPAGFHVISRHSRYVHVGWTAAKGAAGYHVWAQQGSRVARAFDVPAGQPSAQFDAMTPGAYTFAVYAKPAKAGAPHASLSATVPK